MCCIQDGRKIIRGDGETVDMPLRVTQANYRGFALIDLGRTVEPGPIRLSFQRQDADPRHLGMRGWQAQIAWHATDRLASNGSNTVVRVGPAVVDRIDELVAVEIAIEGEGSLGTVDWPQLTKSRKWFEELRPAPTPKLAILGAPRVGRSAGGLAVLGREGAREPATERERGHLSASTVKEKAATPSASPVATSAAVDAAGSEKAIPVPVPLRPRPSPSEAADAEAAALARWQAIKGAANRARPQQLLPEFGTIKIAPPAPRRVADIEAASDPPVPARPSRRVVLIGSGALGVAALGISAVWLRAPEQTESSPSPTASGPLIRTLEGHIGPVNSVAIAPDGRTALSGSRDKTLRLWDLANGREIRTFQGHTVDVFSVAIAPNGRTAVSGASGAFLGGGDDGLKLWDLESGREIRALHGHTAGVFSVAFAADGRTALSGSYDKTLKLWDLESGREIRTLGGHTDEVFSVAIAPDGRAALSGSMDKCCKLWDLADGREIRTFRGHAHFVESVAIAPDGGTVLSGSLDKSLKLWELASGGEVRTFQGHTGGVNSVVIAPEGRTALSGSGDGTLKLWDLASGREIRTFEGHTRAVNSVAIAPDGRTAVSGSDDNTLKVWDLT